MQPGDRVYYLYTANNGNRVKYAAVVLQRDGNDALIRIGRYDVDARKVKLLEATVGIDLLEPRNIPCSYEDLLAGAT